MSCQRLLPLCLATNKNSHILIAGSCQPDSSRFILQTSCSNPTLLYYKSQFIKAKQPRPRLPSTLSIAHQPPHPTTMPIFGRKSKRPSASAPPAAAPSPPPAPVPASSVSRRSPSRDVDVGARTPPRLSFERVEAHTAEPARRGAGAARAGGAGAKSGARRKTPVPADAGEVEMLRERTREAMRAEFGKGEEEIREEEEEGAICFRGRGSGAATRPPIMVEFAATIFANGLGAPARSVGFVDMKGWLCGLVDEGMVARWRDAVWMLSDYVRKEKGYVGVDGGGVCAALCFDVETVRAFCNAVTRKSMEKLPEGIVNDNTISANAWRQDKENSVPINLYKIAMFFAAWFLWNETASQEAKAAVDNAIANVRSSSGTTTDEAGAAIVERLGEIYWDEHLLPAGTFPIEAPLGPDWGAGTLTRVPTH